MQDKDPNQPDIEARYRTILILWFAICMSVLMFLLLIKMSPVSAVANRNLSLALNAVGLLPFGLSFLLKQKMLDKSAASRQIDLVQPAYVLAFALCEVAALLALLDHFLTGSSYFFGGFIIAGLGLLLHFPRKKHLLNASFKEF